MLNLVQKAIKVFRDFKGCCTSKALIIAAAETINPEVDEGKKIQKKEVVAETVETKTSEEIISEAQAAAEAGAAAEAEAKAAEAEAKAAAEARSKQQQKLKHKQQQKQKQKQQQKLKQQQQKHKQQQKLKQSSSRKRNKLLKDSFIHSSSISCFIRCITLF